MPNCTFCLFSCFSNNCWCVIRCQRLKMYYRLQTRICPAPHAVCDAYETSTTHTAYFVYTIYTVYTFSGTYVSSACVWVERLIPGNIFVNSRSNLPPLLTATARCVSFENPLYRFRTPRVASKHSGIGSLFWNAFRCMGICRPPHPSGLGGHKQSPKTIAVRPS